LIDSEREPRNTKRCRDSAKEVSKEGSIVMSSARKKGGTARGATATSARGAKSDKSGKSGKSEKGGKTKSGAAARKKGNTASSGGVSGSSHGHGEYNQLGLLEVVQTRFLKDVFDTARGM
jgi:hypothetical protein